VKRWRDSSSSLAARGAAEVWPGLTPENRGRLLRAVVQRVEVDEPANKVSVHITDLSGGLPIPAPTHQLVQEAIARGQVRDQAEVARKLGFTRARLTHRLDLLLLAPDVQEQVLFLEAVDSVQPV